MRKLVKKNKDGRLTEVDPKALRREALVLQDYIDTASAAEKAEFKYSDWLQPIIDAALEGTLPVPYLDQPYNFRFMEEGLLPWLPLEFQNLYGRFLGRARGDPTISSPATIEGRRYNRQEWEEIIDGERYEWVVFEN